MSAWDEQVPGQTSKTTDATTIMQAIQKMVEGLGQNTGAPGGSSGGGGGVQGTPGTSPVPTIQYQGNRAPNAPAQAAPAPQRPGFSSTGSQSVGDFATKGAATNAGLVSLGNSLGAMFSNIEQKEHAKKATLAENYMTQINSLLASGDPKDREKAMMILEDPKIRKTLKIGLEYVPLEEDKPPEASGVQAAMQKIAQQQQKGGQQQQPQKQPVLPQPSQEQQIQSAMKSAILQKIQQDPASAITMMGQSQLSAAEKHADEFYKSGLGLTPKETALMNSREKLEGLKIYEQAAMAAFKTEADMYKTKVGYEGKVDAAKILANSRKYVADAVKSTKTKDGKVDNFAAGAKLYFQYAKSYLDIVKSGKTADGRPLTDEQKAYYEKKADEYQKQGDVYLNQKSDRDLMEMFMNADEGDDAADADSDKEPN